MDVVIFLRGLKPLHSTVYQATRVKDSQIDVVSSFNLKMFSDCQSQSIIQGHKKNPSTKQYVVLVTYLLTHLLNLG